MRVAEKRNTLKAFLYTTDGFLENNMVYCGKSMNSGGEYEEGKF